MDTLSRDYGNTMEAGCLKRHLNFNSFFILHILCLILYTKPEVRNSVYSESCRAITHLDLLDSLHVCYAIRVVLFNTSCNCEDVGVKDDVIRIEPHLLYQKPVGPFTHFHLVLNSGGLEGWEIHRSNGGERCSDGSIARKISALVLNSSMLLEKKGLHNTGSPRISETYVKSIDLVHLMSTPHITKRETASGWKAGYYTAILIGKKRMQSMKLNTGEQFVSSFLTSAKSDFTFLPRTLITM